MEHSIILFNDCITDSPQYCLYQATASGHDTIVIIKVHKFSFVNEKRSKGRTVLEWPFSIPNAEQMLFRKSIRASK